MSGMSRFTKTDRALPRGIVKSAAARVDRRNAMRAKLRVPLGPRPSLRRLPGFVPTSLAEHAVCRHTPEVGAGCPNWARPDLCWLLLSHAWRSFRSGDTG